MKKNIGLALTAAFISAFAVSVHAQEVNVTIDGSVLETDTPAQIVDGRTLVPMRAIFESLGANVNWDNDTKTVRADRGTEHIDMTIGADFFTKDGAEITLDTPAQIIDGRTMVPVRAISESLGCNVDWDKDTKTVIINTASGNVAAPVIETASETTTEATTETAAEETTEAVPVFEADTEYIAKISAKMTRPKAFDKKYTSDDWYEIHTGVRNYFEQNMLPAIVFSDTAKVSAALQNEQEFKTYIKKIWDDNANAAFTAAGAAEDRINEYLDKAKLSFDTNIKVYTNKLEEGIDLGIIAVADDMDAQCCLYFAIISDSDGNVGLYSLEPDVDSDDYMICVFGEGYKGKYETTLKESEVKTPEKFLVTVDEVIHQQ